MRENLVLVLALAVLYFLVFVEAGLVFAAFRLAIARVRRPFRLPNPKYPILTVVAVVMLGRLALLPVLPIRAPQVTDEFSYLLQGGTFAAGRLVNPQHPLWQHFESIHIMTQPVYASMHQPLQGLWLALGTILFAHPWFGVWISVGVMCATFTWALQGWFPARWAFLGGILAALRLGLLSYFMNSYWGGAPAATGGALVIGALPRLLRKPSIPHSLLMGLGMAILVLTRPYEGFIFCLGVCGWLLYKRRIVSLVPAAAVALVGAVALGYYFQAVTGSPLRPPELMQREQYAIAGVFFWEKLQPEPVYRHQSIRDFYTGWEVKGFTEVNSIGGFLWNRLRHLISAWLLYLGPTLTLPLLFLPRLLRDRRVRPLLIIGAVAAFGLSLNIWFYTHYAAPIACLMLALVIQSMRHLYVWRRRSGAGPFLVRAIPVVTLILVALRIAVIPAKILTPPDWPMTWYSTSPGNTARAGILAQLSAAGGQHLVIVRYGPRHEAVMNEWVYNEADIDDAKVVWARDIPESNQKLLDYFRARKVWTIEPDAAVPSLVPYDISHR